jgi:glutamate synthase (NADPH/NADH) small chain
VLDAFGVEKDARGNAKTDRPYFTSREKVFACGDARRGQSLIVTATSDGRQCAAAVDAWLMGRTALTVFAK